MKKIINKIKSYLLRLLFADELKTCRDMIEVASESYDVDPYFHGMVNGMICLYSIWTDRDPMYLDAPDKWRDERYNMINEKTTTEVDGYNFVISKDAVIQTHLNTITLLRERINQFSRLTVKLESETDERREKIKYLHDDNTKLDRLTGVLKVELEEMREKHLVALRVCMAEVLTVKRLKKKQRALRSKLATAKGRVKGCERVCHECPYKKEEIKNPEPTLKNGWIRSKEDPTVTQIRSRLYVDGECKAGIFETFTPGGYFCYTGIHTLKNESENLKYWTSLETAEREIAEIVNGKTEREGRISGWISEPPGVTCIRSRYYVEGREMAQIIIQGLNEFTALLLHYRNENSTKPRKIEKVCEDGKVIIWRTLTDAQNEVVEILNREAEEDKEGGYYWKDSLPNPDRSAGLASELFGPDTELVAVIRYDLQGYYGIEALGGPSLSIIRYSSNKKPITWETLAAAKKAVEKRVRNREAKKIVVTPKEELKKEQPKPGLYWWNDLLLYSLDPAGNSWSVCIAEIKKIHNRYVGFWQPDGARIKYSGEVCRWPVKDLAGAKEWIETEYRARNSK